MEQTSREEWFVIRDFKWQLYKLLSRLHRSPPLVIFGIGEPLVDEDGDSLIAAPEDGSPGFLPFSGEPMFEDCQTFEFVMDGTRIKLGTRNERVAWVSYDYDFFRESGARRMAKLRYLLAAHAKEGELREYVDNGSAVLYTSINGKQMAAYAYLTDILVVYSASLKRFKSKNAADNPRR